MEVARRFNNAKDVIGNQYVNLTLSKYIETLTGYYASKIDKVNLYSEEAYDKFVTYTFIQGTDHIRNGKLEEGLSNQFYLGVNSYLCDLSNAKILLFIIRTTLTTKTILERKINN